MSVASMPAFLGAAGHAEGLMHVVTRHDPLEKKSVFGGFRKISVWAKWSKKAVKAE